MSSAEFEIPQHFCIRVADHKVHRFDTFNVSLDGYIDTFAHRCKFKENEKEFKAYFKDPEAEMQCQEGENSHCFTLETQKNILNEFFLKNVLADRSLAVLYYEQKNDVPIPADKRLILGIVQIREKCIYDEEYSGCNKIGFEVDYQSLFPLMYPINFRAALEYKGFILPYKALQEHEDFDTASDGIYAPKGLKKNNNFEFMYSAEHISHHTVIDILTQAQDFFEHAKQLIPKNTEKYDQRLEWIEKTLEQTQKEAFPLLGLPTLCEVLWRKDILPKMRSLQLIYGEELRKIFSTNPLSEKQPNKIDLIDLDVFLKEKFSDMLAESESTSEGEESESEISKYAELEDNARKLFLFIAQCSLTPKQANTVRLCIYGKGAWKNTLPKIIENPYLLYEYSLALTEPEGVIPFTMIDKALFQELYNKKPIELPIDCKFRIKACCIYILETQAWLYGHTVFPIRDLVLEIKKLKLYQTFINDDATFHTKLQSHFEDGVHFIQPEKGGETYCQLERYHKINEFVNETLHKRFDKEALSAVEKEIWENRYRLTTNPDDPEEAKAKEQYGAVLHSLANSSLSLLTGIAGSGKTTILRTLYKGLLEDEEDAFFLFLAPTGKATNRMKDVLANNNNEDVSIKNNSFDVENDTHFNIETVAKFLKGDDTTPQAQLGWDNHSMRYFMPLESRNNFGKTTVIIDESSMLTEDMFAALLKALEQAHRIIFVGDPNQLPPIGAGRPFVDLVHSLKKNMAFNTINKEFAHTSKHFAQLCKVHRQKDTDAKANQMLQYFTDMPLKPLDEAQKFFDEFDTSSKSNIHRITWAKQDDLQENIKNFMDETSELSQWQILTPYKKFDRQGTQFLNKIAQELCNKEIGQVALPIAETDSYIYKGDKVVQTKSSYATAINSDENAENILFNGEVGFVSQEIESSKTVHIEFPPNQTFAFNADKKHNLDLAYALTVHKSQGSEYDNVALVLDCKGIFDAFISREMLYTAMTRHKKTLTILQKESSRSLGCYITKVSSATAQRFTNLLAKPDFVFYKRGIVHKTARGEYVMSKSEVIIANLLYYADISYEYIRAKALASNKELNTSNHFAINHNGITYTWKHLGIHANSETNTDNETINQDNTLITQDEDNGTLSITKILENIKIFSSKEIKLGNKVNTCEYDSEKLIHPTLSGYAVRSKSEVIIANALFYSGIDFSYEELYKTVEGKKTHPDFTLILGNKTYYWEHYGLMNDNAYRENCKEKRDIYASSVNTDTQLIETYDEPLPWEKNYAAEDSTDNTENIDIDNTADKKIKAEFKSYGAIDAYEVERIISSLKEKANL